MRAANESQAAARWLYALLSAAAGVTDLVSTRIYEDSAPNDSVLPVVVFALRSSRGIDAAGGDRRVLTEQKWVVRGVVEGGSYAPADALALAIDAALGGQSGQVVVGADTYSILGCVGVDGIRYREIHQGRSIQHVGYAYRLHVHLTP